MVLDSADLEDHIRKVGVALHDPLNKIVFTFFKSNYKISKHTIRQSSIFTRNVQAISREKPGAYHIEEDRMLGVRVLDHRTEDVRGAADPGRARVRDHLRNDDF